MTEMPKNSPTPEEISQTASIAYPAAEHSILVVMYFQRHPVPEAEAPNDYAPEVEKLEQLMTEFEANHSLAELSAITDLSDDLVQMFNYADVLEDNGKLESAIRCFELNNPAYVETYKAKIAAVRAISLSPEDARKFEIRRAAMKDAGPIADQVEKIRKETKIPAQELEVLQGKCRRLLNAVGYYRGKTITHSR
jgi:hypothetical protein